MQSFLNLAYKNTQYSRYPHKPMAMACVVARGGSILSIAHNGKDYNGHAESRALRPHQDYKGATLFVVRGNRRCSKPCPRCMDKIRAAGIKKIVYINLAMDVVVEKVR